jgi:membrane protease YdiL (CAAX protease family)
MNKQPGSEPAARTDPALDRRRLLLFGAGLLAVYLLGVTVIVATHTQQDPQVGFLVIMFAPLAGALLARFAGPGVIRWGRLSWWIVAGLVPELTVFGAYAIGSTLGLGAAHFAVLAKALILSPIVIVISSVQALGEEGGWRGFLWPLLRRRWSFGLSALVIGVVWWSYHAPLIFLGWYGSLAGLPAFTVAVAGLTLFTGVLADRSRAVWPSVIAHGAWNALVATGFAVAGNATLVVFAGSSFWVGEFGWLAALASATTGALATWWHLSRPMTRSFDTPPTRPTIPTSSSRAPGA